MKFIFSILFSLIVLITFAQSPQNPTNPKKPTQTPAPTQNPAPTQSPTPTQNPNRVPPVTEQQIPPSRNPAPGNSTNVPSTTPSVPSSSTTGSNAPNTSPKTNLPPITGSDQEQIKATIIRLFDAMRMADSTIAKPLFAPNCKLYTPIVNTATGVTTLNEQSLSGFFKAIGTPRKQLLDERVLKFKIDIDGPLAQVWADYNLYVDDKFIHCGIDAFHLYKNNEGWKIFHLADTRRKTGCLSDPKDEIVSMLDKWNADCTAANADAYFGAFTPDGIFLGTDATERWTRDEFRAWAKPAFDSKKTWDFKATKRNISFNQDESLAWFDEELSTWMGPSRGSGVLIKTTDGWKIKQYNLTLLVPNEKLQDYLKLIGLRK